MWNAVSERVKDWNRTLSRSFRKALDRLCWYLSVYIVPVVLAGLSIGALVSWDSLYEASPDTQLELRVVVENDTPHTLDTARVLLAAQKPVSRHETRLSEAPLWFSVTIPDDAEAPARVELPSRHATELKCWDSTTGQTIGEANASGAVGGLARVKAGYRLEVAPRAGEIICRAQFQGPAKLTALLWTQSKLDVSAQDFHRNSGLLDGGMLILALFVLLTALINRQSLYVIFAAWLLLTLRISSTSAGWDSQWLNHAVPSDWLVQSRSIARGIWAVLTVTLYKALLREELKLVRSSILVQGAEILCLALLLAAFALERDQFLKVMWLLGTGALLLLMMTLAEIVMRTRSPVAIWYSAALTVTLVSGLSEIFAAAFGLNHLVSLFNTVTAALASALLASLAIAAQMRQEHSARLAAQAQLQHTYDAIPIGMFTLDLQGHFTSINPALRRMLGPRAFKTSHNTWQQYFGADIWQQLLDLAQNRPDDDIEIRTQMDITGHEGPRRYLVKAALSGEKIEGSLQDVTDKSIATDELSFLADNDALTKVLNRRGVEKAFDAAVAAVDEAHPLALAYLDLDRFKLINDLYGHNAGDEVLRQVCHRVEGLLAPHMRLGRVGGDEFVILLPDTRMPLATVISRGIIESIDGKPFRVGEKAFYVRGSIGLIEVSAGTQFKEVLSTSDRACREAKTGQYRGLVVYEQGSPAFKEHQAELRLIGELSANEDLDGLFLEMQPIMSLMRPYDALNFEVLLRMRDASGELVPVSRVIAAAEDSGRMSKIDHWVLSTTLEWLEKHRSMLHRTQFVCINLSGASLNDEEFMQEVFDTLRRNSRVSNLLCIEITESIALHDLKNTRRFIDKVRSYGARVALDDFGAGYTSFSYLKELPADLLKIDGSFIVNMNQHPANVSIVEAIVNLARNLGMKTVAEWAEDAATVQALAEIGVDYVQGYAVARPMAPDKLLEVNSAAGFIKNAELLQFVDAQDRQNNPLSQLDLLGEGDKPSPPKIH